MTTLLIGIIITLILSAIFSGMEIAFISATKLNVEIRKNQGTRTGQIIARFFEKPSNFLSAMLVGNNIALIMFAILMEKALLQDYIQPLLINAPNWVPQLLIDTLPLTIITTIIVLIFGEFLPKIFFRLFADRILYILAYPIAFFKFLLSPISWVMMKCSEFLLGLFIKTPHEQVEEAFTRLDLAKFVESTGYIDRESDILDTELFSNVLEMNQTRVRDCMIPRTEIEAVELYDDVQELLDLFIETNLSKILVYKESIDEVIGYVHHQNMLDRPSTIKSITREIPIIPEAMPVYDLMNKFIKERISIACVVDEFGGTSGLITLEDVLEEIFGEIEDEHDAENEELEEIISDNLYKFSGRLEIDYLNEKYPKLQIPEGEYHTLSGYIVMTLGDIPETGQIIDLNGLRITLELVSDTKIETVKVEIISDDEF